MSTRREDKSSDKQRFSTDDANARQEGGSPNQSEAEPETLRAPPKVAPKFAREYVGTESPAARLMRLAQGLAGKRSEEAKKPAADDQRSAPPPHSAPPKFNPKFAKEFIGTPPPRAEQASSSTPPPPPKPPNTPPPFDPRFSSEYVGTGSPFATKGKAANNTVPPPPPGAASGAGKTAESGGTKRSHKAKPGPTASDTTWKPTPPPPFDPKFAKNSANAAGPQTKPKRPTASSPPPPPAASVPPPKVDARYAKEAVGRPSPFTVGGASAKPHLKPAKPASAQPRAAAKAASGAAGAKPAAPTPTASSQQARAKSSSNWRESKSSGRGFDVPLGQTISLEQFVSNLYVGLEQPETVLLIDRYCGGHEQKLELLVRALQRQVPGLRLTVWSKWGQKNLAALPSRIVASPPIVARGYNQIHGLGNPHARHIVVGHKHGWRVWHLDHSILGLVQEPIPGFGRVGGDITVTERSVDKLPKLAIVAAEYEAALL
jgi:hypothetical protein